MELDLVDLSTKREDLGLVKAFCKKCRHTLIKIEEKPKTNRGRMPNNNLKCTFCGNKEHRKIAQDYGFVTKI